jgi:hypothetical protein
VRDGQTVVVDFDAKAKDLVIEAKKTGAGREEMAAR